MRHRSDLSPPRMRLRRGAGPRRPRDSHHRGPDGRRHWIAPHGRVGLGHARLSIIDLATGDQPIANEDGRRQIVVNGEFYDFERIRARARAARGHRFRTRSDSEIALHLYEDLGPDCLHQLRGEFAFVLWDEAQQRLFAARDRFGIKPLFYAVARRRALPRLRGQGAVRGRRARRAGTARRCSTPTILRRPADRTLFEGVSQVPPGHYLLAARAARCQLLRYWDFDYPLATRPGRAALRRRVRRGVPSGRSTSAVRLRLRADVPVGCYLSGGLDSCAVLGLAARHHAARSAPSR